MPLISYTDVVAYSSIPKIVARGEKLENEILRADEKIFSICNHDFTGDDYVEGIPDKVKLAAILWTEYYALVELGKESADLKSESLPDYSYVRANNSAIAEPDTMLLLKDYIEDDSESSSKLVFKMRAI
jgi:hypothetical protein